MAELIGKNTVIVDLDKPLVRKNVGLAMASGDALANRYGVQLFRNGVAEDASSCTVTGYLIMPNDETLRIKGTASGNLVYVDIPQSGYAYDGAFTLTIKVIGGTMTKAVAIFDGMIARTSSDNIISGDRVLYGVEEVLALIDEMEQAESDANTAAGNANTAATSANNAASNANTATSNANTATSRANTAAAAIEGMTVSASDVSAGTPASVEITDANGAKNIHFNLRQGITGVTPNITFQVATGAAGSQVQVSQSGTPENPVVNLTIPRGDTGAVDGVDYYEESPAALGTASPGTANGLARGDHVHPMPSATDVGAAVSVDGVQADATGNVAVGAVRYGAAQELTDEQKVQALANLGFNFGEVASVKMLCDAGNFAPNAAVTFSDAPINYDFFIARIGYRGSVGMMQGSGNTSTISFSSISGGSSSTMFYAVRLQGDMTGKTLTVYQSYTSTIKADSTVFATPESVNIGPIYGVKFGGA